jgi:hypothetical protein
VTPGKPSLGNRRSIPHPASGCTSADSSTRPVRPYLLCQVVRGRWPAFAPRSAHDGVQVSHGDAVIPALILAKCGPSISTLDCRLSLPRAPAWHPRLPSDGSPAEPPPRFLLHLRHPPVCDPPRAAFPVPRALPVSLSLFHARDVSPFCGSLRRRGLHVSWYEAACVALRIMAVLSFPFPFPQAVDHCARWTIYGV